MKKRGFSFKGVMVHVGVLVTAVFLASFGINYLNVSYSDETVSPIHTLIRTEGSTLYYDLSLPNEDNKPHTVTKWIRFIRNEARLKAKDDNNLTSLQLILRRDKKVIYDETTNNIANFPSISSKISNSLNSEEVLQKVESAFTYHNIKALSLDIKDCSLGGHTAVVQISSSLPEVNLLLPDIESLFDSLNKIERTDISQYELTFLDSQSQLLLYLSADLVYRDFLWWQTPALKEIWTGAPQLEIND